MSEEKMLRRKLVANGWTNGIAFTLFGFAFTLFHAWFFVYLCFMWAISCAVNVFENQ